MLPVKTKAVKAEKGWRHLRWQNALRSTVSRSFGVSRVPSWALKYGGPRRETAMMEINLWSEQGYEERTFRGSVSVATPLPAQLASDI
jgi:hypothetical protein